MKKSLLLSLLGLTYLCNQQNLVSAANTDAVDYTRYELDSGVKDIMWCGTNNEFILILSDNGSVYRSRDKGTSWKKLQQAISMSGQKVADDDQEIGRVQDMMQSPNEDNMVVFIGSHGINWVTEDCGATIRGLNSGKKIHEFQFHPTMKYWALAATWTDCQEFGDDPCKIYKELFFTQDMGKSWKFLKEYVYDFAWAYTQTADEQKIAKLPKERVFITHDPKATGHQNSDKKQWSPQVNLYYSDDFFTNQKKLALNNGNSIIKTENYMFIARATQKEWVEIYVSTYQNGFLDFERAKLPTDAIQSKTFTVMDTSEQTVFLHVQNHGPTTPLGNIFISDGFGKNFSLSLENVLRGTELVDFEKINSLEGVFIANRFDTEHSHDLGFSKILKQDKNKKGDKEFSESDIIQERMQRNRQNQQNMNSNINKKQRKTKESILKEGDEFQEKDLQKSIRTFITHNKGGKWDLIKAPSEDSYGKKIDCYLEEGCSLNLEIYSSNGLFAPPYSQDSSIGLIMGVGNTGYELDRVNTGKVNTYLSRDGGASWLEVKKGSYIYEVGDHGGLIVMARNHDVTQEVYYSYNEGLTWHTLEISDKPFYVTNIIIEPMSVSQEFVVYGVSKGDDSEVDKQKGLVFTIDFKQLHEPQCKGADRPGDSDSDYEFWTPFDGRHGDQKCFLGQQITYIRRKREAECFNGEELERKILRSFCQCTELDYECDYGYTKDPNNNLMCVKEPWMTYDSQKATELTEAQSAQCSQLGYYTVSQGYRKVPGDKCYGGLDLNPIVYTCSPIGIFSVRTLGYLIIIGAILYFGWPVLEALIIALPIPDPKDIKDKLKSMIGGSTTQGTKRGKKDAGKQYTKNFNQAPEGLESSSDEEDGNRLNNSGKRLNYDNSDDDKDDLKGDELIQLDGASPNTITRDRTNTAAENIPKLPKPQ